MTLFWSVVAVLCVLWLLLQGYRLSCLLDWAEGKRSSLIDRACDVMLFAVFPIAGIVLALTEIA